MDEVLNVDLNDPIWSFSFECPRCGQPIFLEEEIGRDFDLLELRLEDYIVSEAVIRCSKCKATIRLSDFGLLSRIGCFHE